MKNLFIAIAMVSSLASCSSSTMEETTSTDSTQVVSTPVDTMTVEADSVVCVDTTSVK